MADAPLTVGQLADEVRSKNAGPFWLTLDVFLASVADYQALIASEVITPAQISRLYEVDADTVQIFQLPHIRVVKISFPRAVPAGSFMDRDQHAGQQHVPLSLAPVFVTREEPSGVATFSSS